MSKKPRFLMCICTGQCPGFKSLDLWELINTVRQEMDVEYAIVHPQLCVDDGDRFLKDFIKDENELYIIGACDPKMQIKMMKDAFQEAGGDFKKQAIPLDLRNLTTEQAIDKVRKAVESIKQTS
ncbi:MAG: hypothetical protein DRJ06_05195 [Candidatus Aminicenantes bacterium]|nr:MAG: hypothetical protein DRJ06_05195 [Candidatus Aminicenantes bacterium]HDJ22287.1 hypothetical protein [Candidatus Aminicenantes bacterium]